MLTKDVQLTEVESYGCKSKGLFATHDIPAGSLVWYWKRDTEPLVTFTRQQIMDHPQKELLSNFSYMIADDTFASTLEPEEDPCWFFNHSCEPNCWFEEDDKIVTCRLVKKGEQLCYDYACTETEVSLLILLQYGVV